MYNNEDRKRGYKDSLKERKFLSSNTEIYTLPKPYL